MSRLESSFIAYPFINPASDAVPDSVGSIKDMVLYPDLPGPSAGSAQGSRSYACFYSRSPSSIVIRTYRFIGDNRTVVYDIVFNIPAAPEGIHIIRSGRSVLILNKSEYPPGTESGASLTQFEVEPCCIRWAAAPLYNIVFANEERLADPLDRYPGMPVNIVRTFNQGGDPVRLWDGYNISLDGSSDSLGIYASPGAGAGRAPYNIWDDKPPPSTPDIKPVKSINGQPPGANGNFEIKTTKGMSVTPGDIAGSIRIIDENA